MSAPRSSAFEYLAMALGVMRPTARALWAAASCG